MALKFNFDAFFSKQKNITATNDGDYELNIQPQASVLGVFSRLNYKAWYAIAEFVDNSTASYYQNRKDIENELIDEINLFFPYIDDCKYIDGNLLLAGFYYRCSYDSNA